MSNIKVYSKNLCPQCDMTKKLLAREGIEFEVINISEVDEEGNPTKKSQEAIDYLVEVLGFRQMPVIVADGVEPFSGFQPEKLKGLKG